MAVSFEENREERTCLCTSDKFLTQMTIFYTRGSALPYEFRTNVGPVPEVLAGRFTTIEKAKEAFTVYDAKYVNVSDGVKRKEIAERYAAKKASQDS